MNYGEKLLLAPPRSCRKHNIANVMIKRTMEATPIVAVYKPASSRLPANGLRQLHPPASVDRSVVPDPSSFNAVSVTENDVIKAIRSFPAGSVAGPDGIRPQHHSVRPHHLQGGRKGTCFRHHCANKPTIGRQMPFGSSYSSFWW